MLDVSLPLRQIFSVDFLQVTLPDVTFDAAFAVLDVVVSSGLAIRLLDLDRLGSVEGSLQVFESLEGLLVQLGAGVDVATSCMVSSLLHLLGLENLSSLGLSVGRQSSARYDHSAQAKCQGRDGRNFK